MSGEGRAYLRMVVRRSRREIEDAARRRHIELVNQRRRAIWAGDAATRDRIDSLILEIDPVRQRALAEAFRVIAAADGMTPDELRERLDPRNASMTRDEMRAQTNTGGDG